MHASCTSMRGMYLCIDEMHCHDTRMQRNPVSQSGRRSSRPPQIQRMLGGGHDYRGTCPGSCQHFPILASRDPVQGSLARGKVSRRLGRVAQPRSPQIRHPFDFRPDRCFCCRAVKRPGCPLRSQGTRTLHPYLTQKLCNQTTMGESRGQWPATPHPMQ